MPKTSIDINPTNVVVEVLDDGTVQLDFIGGPPGPEGPSGTLQNVDDELAGSDLSSDGLKATLEAAEALVFGNVCYINTSGKCAKADASATATSRAVVMATETLGIDASGDFLLLGFARDDSWAWTVGKEVFLSETAGELTQTAPIVPDSVTQVLGVAIHADRVYFNPSSDVVVHA